MPDGSRSHYQADSDLVFCHPETGNPLDASKLRRRFRSAVERAGVRPVTFHDLRHTYGTAMASVGTPLRSLMEWMGHADLATTLLYATTRQLRREEPSSPSACFRRSIRPRAPRSRPKLSQPGVDRGSFLLLELPL